MLEAARDRVAAAARRVAEAGLVVGTAGNVSERAGELVAVSPTGCVLEELTARQVAVVDLQGRQMDGDLAPTSELELHLGVYRRYGAGAVVHTHAPFATALSCVLDELPVVHYHLLILGGAIRVAPYATFGTPELAELTLDALEDRAAALMANHGAIVRAQDLTAAVELSLVLEWACGVYHRATAIRTPRTLDPDQCSAALEAFRNHGHGGADLGHGGDTSPSVPRDGVQFANDSQEVAGNDS